MGKRKISADNINPLIGTSFNQRQIATFHKEVYNIKKIDNSSLIDSILHYCEQRDIDPADIAPLIDPCMLSDISKEANEFRLLKPSARIHGLDL